MADILADIQSWEQQTSSPEKSGTSIIDVIDSWERGETYKSVLDEPFIAAKPPAYTRPLNLEERTRMQYPRATSRLPQEQVEQFGRTQEQMDVVSTGDRIINAAQAGGRGLARVASALPKDLALVADAVNRVLPKSMQRDVPIEESFFYEIGKGIDSLADAVLPMADPRQSQSVISQQLPEAAGTMAGFVGGGVVGRLAKLGKWAVTAVLGAGVEAASVFEEAKAHGASDADALKAAGWAAPIGSSEALPLGRILDRFGGARGLRRVIADAIKGAIEEGTQEFAQTVGENIVASAYYDKGRDPLEGTGTAAGIGGFLGLVTSLGVGYLGHRLNKTRPSPEASPGPTPAPQQRFTRETLLTPDGVRAFAQAMPEAAAGIAAKDAPSRADVSPVLARGERMTAADRRNFARLLRENQNVQAIPEAAQEPVPAERADPVAQEQEQRPPEAVGQESVPNATNVPEGPAQQPTPTEKSNEVQQTEARQEEGQEGQRQDVLTPPPAEPAPQGRASPEIRPSLRRRIKRLSEAAQKRIEQRQASGFLFSNNLDPRVLRDYAIVGADMIIDGALTAAEFTKRMVDRFGDAIQPHVSTIWEASREKLRKMGRPDLAVPVAEEPAQNAVMAADVERNRAGLPAKRPQEIVDFEANSRLSQNYDGEKVRMLEIGSAANKDVPTDTDVAVAKKIIDAEGLALREKYDSKRAKDAILLAMAYREGGTKAGRALAQRRDFFRTPEEAANAAISEALMEPPEKVTRAIEQAQAAGNTEVADKLAGDFAAKQLPKIIAQVEDSLGVDLSDVQGIASQPRLATRVVREIQARKATFSDKLFEYWINSILSGIQTAIVNVTGTPLNTAYRLFVERPVEAALNLIVKDPNAPDLREFLSLTRRGELSDDAKAMMRGFIPGMSRAAQNAVLAWGSEVPQLERQHTQDGRQTFEFPRAAIAGKAGRVVRALGTRQLLAADDFNKTLAASVDVMMLSARRGLANGLRGDALTDFINQEVSNPHSQSWSDAITEAQEFAFQEKSTGRVAHQAKKIGKAVQGIPIAGRYIAPFVNISVNLFRQGFKKTPPVAAFDLGRAVNKYLKTGDKSGITGAGARLLISSVASAAIWELVSQGLITGGDDKDRPYSIRIGDDWYSYSRFEPFATAMGLMVDGVSAMQTGSARQIVSVPLTSLINQVSSKTFLKTLGDVVDAVRGTARADGIKPGSAATRWAQEFVASWVPNVYRQARRESRSSLANRKVWGDGGDGWRMLAKRTLQETEIPQLFGYLRDASRVDIWGREMATTRDGTSTLSMLRRILVPIRVRAHSEFVGDGVIDKYNKLNPDDPWYPSIPDPSYTQGGERKFMSEEEYRTFLVDAGNVAHRAVLFRAWPGEPGEFEKDEMSAIFRASRKAVRDRMFGNKKPSGVEQMAAEVAMARIKYHRNRARNNPESKQWLRDSGLDNQAARLAEFARLRTIMKQGQ